MLILELSVFLAELVSSPPLLVISLLTAAVILVNGWTDAPNAIATCVSTRAIRARPAILMAAVFNFLGVFVMTSVNKTVAQTIYKMVDFGNNAQEALIALCAALVAIVVWATAAWWFGIPTSESHALIAGLTGAAIAVHSSLEGVNPEEWVKVFYGMFFSTVAAFSVGFVVVKIVEAIFKGTDRRKSRGFFKYAQIFGGGAMAFMHGAQDGQKFMGVFLLGIALTQGDTTATTFLIPVWLMVFCSAVMGFGTSIGGYKIIKTVGMDMVKLEQYQGFSADAAASLTLFLLSWFGVPVSTTHTKTTSMMGVAAARRVSAVNWGVVKEMVLTWVLTFPGCGLIGFIMAKLFVHLF